MIYSYYDLLNHLCRCCVASLTHMLQTSSFNQMHVLVVSNSISFSCLEGRIYIITLLNSLPLPFLIILLNSLPVLVALKILWDILSFTRLFMVNTRPLVGCLKNSDRKAKQLCVIPRVASSFCVHCSSKQCPIFECVWFCNRHRANRTTWLEWLLNHLQ